MRPLITGILISVCLIAPCAAQSSGGDSKPAQPQNQTAKAAAPAGKDQVKPADPAPQAAKDDSISNYDVNGSNASDAMGASR